MVKRRGRGKLPPEGAVDDVPVVSESNPVLGEQGVGPALRDATDFIVVHCSATKRDQDIGFDEIDAWHRERGWEYGCGYHKIVRRDGTVEDGRPIDSIGAHSYGYNKRSVGVCLVGGLDDAGNACNNFNSSQLVALGALLVDLGLDYPDAEVLGHRDLSPDIDGDGVISKWEWTKECPCMDIRADLPMLLRLGGL